MLFMMFSSEEDFDDPISLMDVTTENKTMELASASVLHNGNKETPKMSPNKGKHRGKFLNLPATFFNNPRNIQLLRQCRQMAVGVVKCDDHAWYHRKLIASQKLDPKVSLPLKQYLDNAAEFSDDVVDKTSLKQDRVQIVGGAGLPPHKQNNVSGQTFSKECVIGKVRVEPVGNFIVSDNSVLTEPNERGVTKKQPVKLKITEILSINEMSSKRISQINFKKNKGLVGLKISRTSLVEDEINKSLVISKKQKVNTLNNTPKKMKHVKKHVKHFEKPGPKRTKTKLSIRDDSIKNKNAAHKDNDKVIKSHLQTEEKKINTAAQNNLENICVERRREPNVSEQNLLPKDLEKGNHENTFLAVNAPVALNTTVQVRKDLGCGVPNNPIVNESTQLITEIKTENEIKKEVPVDVNENTTLPDLQGSLPSQAAPAAPAPNQMEPTVTRVYNNVNSIIPPFVDGGIRPLFHQVQHHGSNMNNNQHLYNNDSLPPFSSFQHPTPEMTQNYCQMQPDSQQYQHINTHHQLQELRGSIAHQYQEANMQWNNVQHAVKVNAPYQGHPAFQSHQSHVIAPAFTQINLNNAILTAQCVTNPMMPPPPRSSINTPTLMQNDLINRKITPATPQGIIANSMHPPPPPPPYAEHKNSVSQSVYGAVINASSDLHCNKAVPSTLYESNVINTNSQMLSQSNSNQSNVNFKPKRTKIPYGDQNLPQNTTSTWTNAPIPSATTTNWAAATPQNLNTLSNPYNNDFNCSPMNAYDLTNQNYVLYAPTQLSSSTYDDTSNVKRVLTKNTGEIKKVNLVTIRKNLFGTPSPSILDSLRDKIQARNKGKAGNPLQTVKQLQPIKRGAEVKKGSSLKKVKVFSGVKFSDQASNPEALPKGYSPPILPIPSVRKTYEILMNSKQFRMCQNTLSPATMEIMKNSGRKPWTSTHLKVMDNTTGRENAVKDVKKISLDEYKKRISKPDGHVIDLTDDERKSVKPKYQITKLYGTNGDSEVNSISGENNERRSVDSQDLGYGSDSTVKL